MNKITMNTRKVFFVFSVVKGITSPRYARHNPLAPPSSREPRRPSERGRHHPDKQQIVTGKPGRACIALCNHAGDIQRVYSPIVTNLPISIR